MSQLDHFSAIWLGDFEFRQLPGERPQPICMVAREFRSGRTVQLWEDELHRHRAPPFSVGPATLYIAYFASAEVSCHLALGWPIPERILDLYIEFRCKTNGRATPHGRGLLGALLYHGLDAMGATEKDSMRALALRGGPWSDDERRALLEYCQGDVDALARLLPAMLPDIDLPRALLRARYMPAVARIERAGVPIDVETYERFKVNWDQLLRAVIGASDIYGLYDDISFKTYRFRQWLVTTNRAWPHLDSGCLDLQGSTFSMMQESDPDVGSIAALRATLAELRLPECLPIGTDGRNRCLLSPYSSKTGRNQPSNARFVFGPAAWLRGLIRPPPGRALAYLDWEQQEFAIGAALSGDPAMLAAYESGDPYWAFGQQSGIIPRDGIREDYEAERKRCKRCCLGTMYGMSAWSLARQIGQQPAHARELLELHKRIYPRYWQWSDMAEYAGMLGGRLTTVFGWPLNVTASANPRALRNFVVQAHGAELLRLACCLVTERGITLCAPIHDAVLIESAADDIGDAVAASQQALNEAARVVLAGFELRSEAKIVHYPDRLLDDKQTRPTWDRVMGILDTIDRLGPAGVTCWI